MKTTCPKCGAAEWSVEEMKGRSDTWLRTNGKWKCGSETGKLSNSSTRQGNAKTKIERAEPMRSTSAGPNQFGNL